MYFLKTSSPATCDSALAEEPKEVITMSVWLRYPTLYEINTWVWLSELSLKTGTLR